MCCKRCFCGANENRAWVPEQVSILIEGCLLSIIADIRPLPLLRNVRTPTKLPARLLHVSPHFPSQPLFPLLIPLLSWQS